MKDNTITHSADNYVNARNIIIVIPAYNAERKVASVIASIPHLNGLTHIVVVNDGSRDSTADVLARVQKTTPLVTIVTHEHNKGYGAAQKSGFTCALKLGADIIALLHSDGQTDASRLPDLLEPLITNSADIVLGSRMIGARPFNTPMPLYKYIGNRILTTCENLAFHSRISEFHTGYICYSAHALRTIPYQKLHDRFHFDGHMIVMALIAKLRITERKVPIIYADETSHLRVFAYARDVLLTIWKYWRGDFHKLFESS